MNLRRRLPSIFRVPVGVVVVNATVTDKQGNPVTDLTREDFRVFEDGKPQDIQTFVLESHNPVKTAEALAGEPAKEEASRTAHNFGRPHMISIMIDDLASAYDDGFLRVTEAVANFIEKDMAPGDQVGMRSSSGKVAYPFSSDKQMLLEQVSMLSQKLSRIPVERSGCPVLTDLQAQKITNGLDPGSLDIAVREAVQCLTPDMTRKAEDEEEVIANANKRANLLMASEAHARMAASTQYQETMHRNRNLLIALRQHLRSLRHFDASKSLVLFSDGFLHQDLTFELQDVVEQALRSGVVLNTVDIRGVYDPSYIPATEQIISSDYSFSRKRAEYLDDAAAQEEPLSQLANDTGGVFFRNSNDIYSGIRQIGRRQGYYYILT